MDIPESTRALVEEDALRDGINELVAKLNGKKMIADSWTQSREYAGALGMAALARSDYVVFMHDLWDATWGAAGALELGRPDDSEPNDPHTIWEDEEIVRYVDFARPVGGCVHAIFSVSFEPGEGVTLDALFNDADYDEVDVCTRIADSLTRWHSKEHDNFDHPLLYSSQVEAKDLDTAADTLREAARELVVFLKAGEIR